MNDWDLLDYPAIGVYGGPGGTKPRFRGLTILFSQYGHGKVIRTPVDAVEAFPIGHFSSNWAMNCFIPKRHNYVPGTRTIRELLR